MLRRGIIDNVRLETANFPKIHRTRQLAMVRHSPAIIFCGFYFYFWNAAASLADQYEGVGAGSGTLAHRARASLRPASEVRTKKTEREGEEGG